jgi:hypothetical protein
MPPRSLRSIVTSVAFPAFLLGHDPTKRLIAASYGSELAVKHASDFRAILRSDWYQHLFPGTRISPLKNTRPRSSPRGEAIGFPVAFNMVGSRIASPHRAWKGFAKTSTIGDVTELPKIWRDNARCPLWVRSRKYGLNRQAAFVGIADIFALKCDLEAARGVSILFRLSIPNVLAPGVPRPRGSNSRQISSHT